MKALDIKDPSLDKLATLGIDYNMMVAHNVKGDSLKHIEQDSELRMIWEDYHHNTANGSNYKLSRWSTLQLFLGLLPHPKDNE